jgi:uncharacterized protein YbgA (DUF1722 family)
MTAAEHARTSRGDIVGAMRDSAAIDDFAALLRFHTRHKLLLMSRSPAALNELGRLVANARKHSLAAVVESYMKILHETLERPATRGSHVNALQHMAGYFRDLLADEEHAEVTKAIAAFGAGRTELDTPLALIRRHATEHKVAYLLDQVYLDESAAAELHRD